MFERNPATARMGEEILPFELGYLPEYFQKKAAAELNETPERKEQSLRHIKELLKRIFGLKKMFERNPATATIGKEILPFEVGYLPEFFQKKAAAELNESQEMKTEKMTELKKLLRGMQSLTFDLNAI
ncbi:hypothetical protein AVEN_58116-1 [Araneus ventricosus]|uniref:Uncharacterized protein n=1 Tax=Araneus ventricosus TaxID=182803 RepID=A0A4Y2KYA7_ARAVE|nr:hypothetical protein AVEN_58116-1 [Araneus ventricosus]